MFIDIHVHAYRKECPPADGRLVFPTVEDVLRRYDELQIERGCLLPLIGPEVYLPQSNEDCIEMCEQSGGRLIPCCNVDPRGISNAADAPLDVWLQHYKKRGCRIVGEVLPNLPFSDPRCQNLFRHIADAGMAMTFDMSTQIGVGYGLCDEPGLRQLEATLCAYPNLTVFGHGPLFWAEIGELNDPADRAGYPKYPVRGEGIVPRLLRRHTNLYGDLSATSGYNALARDPAHAIRFLNEFQDKLMFGTDLCYSNQELPLASFLLKLRDEGGISESTFQKIARENAIRVLQL